MFRSVTPLHSSVPVYLNASHCTDLNLNEPLDMLTCNVEHVESTVFLVNSLLYLIRCILICLLYKNFQAFCLKLRMIFFPYCYKEDLQTRIYVRVNVHIAAAGWGTYLCIFLAISVISF